MRAHTWKRPLIKQMQSQVFDFSPPLKEPTPTRTTKLLEICLAHCALEAAETPDKRSMNMFLLRGLFNFPANSEPAVRWVQGVRDRAPESRVCGAPPAAVGMVIPRGPRHRLPVKARKRANMSAVSPDLFSVAATTAPASRHVAAKAIRRQPPSQGAGQDRMDARMRRPMFMRPTSRRSCREHTTSSSPPLLTRASAAVPETNMQSRLSHLQSPSRRAQLRNVRKSAYCT